MPLFQRPTAQFPAPISYGSQTPIIQHQANSAVLVFMSISMHMRTANVQRTHTHMTHTHDTYKHILQNNIDILKEKEKDSAREASGSYYMKIWLWQIPVLYHNVEVPIQVKLGFLQLICIL